MSKSLSNTAKDIINACRKGQFNQVQELFDAGLDLADINHPDFSPLNVALKHGRWRIAKHLLEQQLLPNEHHCPAIIAATQYNKDTIQGLELVFSHTADLAATDKNGRTALMTACLLGHEKKVKYLLSNKDMLEAQDQGGMNAYLDAIINQSPAILDLLLQQGIDIHHQNKQGDNALLIALQQPAPSQRIIKTLLEHGVDPTIKNRQGKSAFSVAEKKQPSILKLFIKKIEADKQIELPLFGQTAEDPDPDSKPIPKATSATQAPPQKEPKNEAIHKAWFSAVNDGNLGKISQTLRHGINIDVTDERGCTALIHAAGKGYRAVASYLIQNQANIEHQSTNGSTPLSSAIISNSQALVGLLLKNGANPNGCGPGGYPYVSLAASQWSEACLSMLLDAGAEIQTVDEAGMPLYHHVAIAAEYYGHTAKAKNTLRLLHQLNLDINIANQQGNTALHLLCGAMKTKQYKVDDTHLANIAHEMLKLGANPKLSNNEGFTAIQYAKKHGLLNTNGVILSFLEAW